MNKLFLNFFALVMFSSCLVFESKIYNVIDLYSGYSIIYDPNDPAAGNQLIYSYPDDTKKIILTDCLEVYKDSNIFYIKSLNFVEKDSVFSYHRFFNEMNQNTKEGNDYKIQNLTKEIYLRFIVNCKKQYLKY